jgi:hypothetical protein
LHSHSRFIHLRPLSHTNTTGHTHTRTRVFVSAISSTVFNAAVARHTLAIHDMITRAHETYHSTHTTHVHVSFGGDGVAGFAGA